MGAKTIGRKKKDIDNPGKSIIIVENKEKQNLLLRKQIFLPID